MLHSCKTKNKYFPSATVFFSFLFSFSKTDGKEKIPFLLGVGCIQVRIWDLTSPFWARMNQLHNFAYAAFMIKE